MPSTHDFLGVKEETEQDADSTVPCGDDMIPVPPGVVLDTLDALLRTGKALLRYSHTLVDDGWGVNGTMNGHWCSFAATTNRVCYSVDADGWWVTEGTDVWADSEMERLDQLCTQAKLLPAANAHQPSALAPRKCRKAVFDHYRTQHAKRLRVKAEDTLGHSARVKARAEHSKEQMASCISATTDSAIVTAIASNQRGLVPMHVELQHQIDKFKNAVKAHLHHVQSPGLFRDFLKALMCRDDDYVLRMLVKQEGLARQYRSMLPKRRHGVSNVVLSDIIKPDIANDMPTGRGTARASPSRFGVDKSVAPSPCPVSLDQAQTVDDSFENAMDATVWIRQSPVNAEQEVLPLLQQCSTDVAVQLVRLVTGRRGLSATKRLNMLRYVRSQASEQGSFRQLFILRGPPGIGKSSWALEQLRLQIGIVDEEQLVATLAHVCSVDDFLMEVQRGSCGAGKAEADLATSKVELAHSQNEVRARLCMEVGIQPLYIDASNLQLWEMAPYVRMAQQSSYDITFVHPSEVFDDWTNAEALLARCVARVPARSVSRPQLEKLVGICEEVSGDCEEAVQQVLGAKRASCRAVPVPWQAEGASKDEDARPSGSKRPAQNDAALHVDVSAKVPRMVDERDATKLSFPAAGLGHVDPTLISASAVEGKIAGGFEEAKTAASLLKSFSMRGATGA